MKLSCDRCGRDIPAEDVNIEYALAKCTGCGSVFGFADRLDNVLAGGDGPRAEVPMPEGITMDDLGYEVVLTYRWFSAKIVFLTLFCVLWDGFLLVWYTIALTQGGPVPMLVVPLVHVAVGAGLTYYVLCGYLNRTRVRAGNGRLQIRHGPLPWPGARDLLGSDLDQFFVTEEVRRTKNGRRTFYRLQVRLQNGEIHKMLDVEARERALYIEQQIERRLGIEDRPMPGELPR